MSEIEIYRQQRGGLDFPRADYHQSPGGTAAYDSPIRSRVGTLRTGILYVFAV
jgi:hypothetical protein